MRDFREIDTLKQEAGIAMANELGPMLLVYGFSPAGSGGHTMVSPKYPAIYSQSGERLEQRGPYHIVCFIEPSCWLLATRVFSGDAIMRSQTHSTVQQAFSYIVYTSTGKRIRRRT